jgi:Domain of unknown function (DUF4267)
MSSQVQVVKANRTAPVAWRSVGVWLAVILIGYLFFNVLRATLNPHDFAVYYGLPLSDPANDAFVYVYALRTLFLGLFGVALLVGRNFKTLALYILIAVVMPIGDAMLVTFKGASLDTIIRHVLVVGVVLLTWFLLRRWVRASEIENGR